MLANILRSLQEHVSLEKEVADIPDDSSKTAPIVSSHIIIDQTILLQIISQPALLSRLRVLLLKPEFKGGPPVIPALPPSTFLTSSLIQNQALEPIKTTNSIVDSGLQGQSETVPSYYPAFYALLYAAENTFAHTKNTAESETILASIQFVSSADKQILLSIVEALLRWTVPVQRVASFYSVLLSLTRSRDFDLFTKASGLAAFLRTRLEKLAITRGLQIRINSQINKSRQKDISSSDTLSIAPSHSLSHPHDSSISSNTSKNHVTLPSKKEETASQSSLIPPPVQIQAKHDEHNSNDQTSPRLSPSSPVVSLPSSRSPSTHTPPAPTSSSQKNTDKQIEAISISDPYAVARTVIHPKNIHLFCPNFWSLNSSQQKEAYEHVMEYQHQCQEYVRQDMLLKKEGANSTFSIDNRTNSKEVIDSSNKQQPPSNISTFSSSSSTTSSSLSSATEHNSSNKERTRHKREKSYNKQEETFTNLPDKDLSSESDVQVPSNDKQYLKQQKDSSLPKNISLDEDDLDCLSLRGYNSSFI